MKNIFKKWTNRKISGTHNHFACYLPPGTGFLSRVILKLLFSGIKISPTHTESIRQLKKKGIVILVNKYKSHFEYFFYHTRYQDEGLHEPGHERYL